MTAASNGLSIGIDRQLLVACTAAFSLGLVVRGFLFSGKGARIRPSPRTTLLPRLSKSEIASLPYPPDSLPGARDVQTSYGEIRVYEFGPEDGKKVLLVHGISTPCLALGAVAHGLAAKGCRVMLFDLFGRGYSEDPSDLPQDLRLFTSQILHVLASSPLSWTGPNKFSIVGYSLGGGISAGFASYLTDLIESVILIAPSGLIRARHFSRANRILYSEGVIPEPLLLRAVKRRLKTPLYPPKKQPKSGDVGTATVVQAETKIEHNSQAPLSQSHPNATIDKAVAHQVENHDAFAAAFMSSIRYAPIQSQHTTWQRLAQRLSQRNSGAEGMKKVLIVTGTRDPIINKVELEEDATQVFSNNVDFVFIDAAHDLPIVKSVDVVNAIWNFWA
jgi:pimeloyl-ACP methyl ester carboxylesterase